MNLDAEWAWLHVLRMSTSFFSKRHRHPSTQLVYDQINPTLRAQIVEILKTTSNDPGKTFSEQDVMINKEYPYPSFKPSPRYFGSMPLIFQFIESGDLDECLDAVEIVFRRVNHVTKLARSIHASPGDDLAKLLGKGLVAATMMSTIGNRTSTGSEDAIAELNRRLREHGVGYQFSADEDQLVRTDSHFLHQDCVEPSMLLLSCPGFEGPAQEFAKAHQHRRNGENKAAVQEATKALESTILAICHARRWVPAKNATLVPLLRCVFDNGLVPKTLESHFQGLRGALESGLPTIGNREARHGQGKDVREMEDYMVELALHLCAASILFLVRAHLAQNVPTSSSARQ